MSTSITAAPVHSDARVMSLIGLAHSTSHFCQLLLPSLFPWLMRDFGLSFTKAGSLTTSPLAFLAVGAVWMCFLFFLVSTMAFGAMQNFAPAVLRNVYGLSIAGAASALSAYLLGGAGGIALGGFLAARNEAHERVVAVMLCGAASLALLLASGAIPAWSVAGLFAAIGFCTGLANPSRDLLVRKAAMARFGQRSFGRVYGFVYSGLDVGLAIAPVLFGRLMDRGRFGAVLAGVALLQGFAVVAALRVGVARAEAGRAELPPA